MSISKNKRLLIVDDEKMNIINLAQSLKSNYEIFVAADGASALEIAEKQVPDLILLDIVMPDMNGFEVLTKLKNSPTTINIPVIFITGLDSAENEERGMLLGAVDYITKPFHKSVVKARIDTHLKMSDYIHTIEKLCMMDALTGLPNRRGFDDRISVEWGRAHREQTPLGLIMIDIDFFKKYNDTYGHPQGDVLLRAVAGVLGNTLNRASDYASRWGGEEFVVLLPDTDIKGTCNIAEQIRMNIKNTKVQFADGTDTSATVSLGATSIIPYDGDTIENFFNYVDKLLYLAKESGRDKVCAEEYTMELSEGFAKV
ncbi:MAG: diguanylate cyclase [Treponema sp.]|jgi:diguanylate cyclase (GGDEF)-like protein|nr:diguanylate cyclase [Treponema sp.]